MTILYFTDLHLWDRDISTRRDRSSQAVLNKLKFLTTTARDRRCQVLISGGDLHQDKIESDEYKAAVIEAFALDEGTENYTLVGNHDILYRTYGSYRKRAMGILTASKSVKILNTQLLSYGMLGISAFSNVEAPFQLKNDVRIIFGHHYINHGSDRLVLKVKDLKELYPNLQYIFTGHDHTEYPTVTMDGVTIVRPGGAMRVSTSTENVNRQPKALILDWDSYNYVMNSIEEVLIPCLPANEAFNLDIKTAAKNVEHQLDEFMGSIAESKVVGFDLEQVVLEKLKVLNDPELTEYISGDLANLLSA